VGGAGKRAFFIAEQLALEQRLGEAGTIDGDERPTGARARLVDRPRQQLLAGAGLAKQQHARLARRNAQQALQQRLESRRATDQSLRRRPAAGLTHGEQGLDKPQRLLRLVYDRRNRDIDELIAMRRMMPMQHALRHAGFARQRQRTRLAGLIAGRIDAMRHLVAAPADRLLACAARRYWRRRCDNRHS